MPGAAGDGVGIDSLQTTASKPESCQAEAAAEATCAASGPMPLAPFLDGRQSGILPSAQRTHTCSAAEAKIATASASDDEAQTSGDHSKGLDMPKRSRRQNQASNNHGHCWPERSASRDQDKRNPYTQSSTGSPGLSPCGKSPAPVAAASKHGSQPVAADRDNKPNASTAKTSSAVPPPTVLHSVLDTLDRALASSNVKQLAAAVHAAVKALGTAEASDAELTQVSMASVSLPSDLGVLTSLSRLVTIALTFVAPGCQRSGRVTLSGQTSAVVIGMQGL